MMVFRNPCSLFRICPCCDSWLNAFIAIHLKKFSLFGAGRVGDQVVDFML